MKTHITNKNLIKTNQIQHLSLKFDIINNNIFDTYLIAEGKISNTPETWSIECQTKDGGIVDNYLYESIDEYKKDLKLFNL